jgi:hypothetical protein
MVAQSTYYMAGTGVGWNCIFFFLGNMGLYCDYGDLDSKGLYWDIGVAMQ